MSLKNDLIAARALIDTPEKWTRETWSRPNGDIRCYCALGAAKETTGWGGSRSVTIEKALNAAVPARYVTPDPEARKVVAFNDDPATTHADILALFDRAIEAAA